MKIDQTTGSATPLRLPAEARRASAPPSSAREGLETLGQAPGNVRRFPEPADGTFDAAKVAAIKEQIRSGHYRIDPQRIADGLLASVHALIADRK